VKLKLDENLSRHLKVPLATLGHDVLTAADEGLLSKPDHAVFKFSPAEGIPSGRLPRRNRSGPRASPQTPGRLTSSKNTYFIRALA
jgi:hypothetical protein